MLTGGLLPFPRTGCALYAKTILLYPATGTKRLTGCVIQWTSTRAHDWRVTALSRPIGASRCRRSFITSRSDDPACRAHSRPADVQSWVDAMRDSMEASKNAVDYLVHSTATERCGMIVTEIRRANHRAASVQSSGGIRFVSYGITSKQGTSETAGTTVNVIDPI